MTSQDYVIKGSCDFCSGSSSLHVTALPRLVVIGIVVFGYTVFCGWRVRFRMFTKTHNLTNMKFYNGITIVCQRNQKSMSVTCPEKHVGYLSEKHVGYLSRKACRLLVQKKRLEGERRQKQLLQEMLLQRFSGYTHMQKTSKIFPNVNLNLYRKTKDKEMYIFMYQCIQCI